MLVGISILLQYFHLLGTGFLFELVEVNFSGLSDSDLSQVACTWCDQDGKEMQGTGAHRVAGKPSWKMRTFFVGELHIDITKEVLAKLKKVEVTIGNDRFLFNRPSPLSEWTACKTLQRVDENSGVAFRYRFPGYSYASLADPGCQLRLIGKAPLDYVLMPLLLILSIVAFKILSTKPWFDRLERMVLTGGVRRKQKPALLWFFTGLTAVVLALFALESMVSYFFV